MKLGKIAILALTPALLCGCATECSFEKFKEKVLAIEKPEDKKLDSYVIKGMVNFKGRDHEIKKKITADTYNLNEWERYVVYVIDITTVYNCILEENKDATYYAGTTFKYEEPGMKVEYDKYGYCTKFVGDFDTGFYGNGHIDISVSYEYVRVK